MSVNSIQKKKLVVLSGAGISAESGLNVFRGSGGLWEGYKIEDVASISGWYQNPEKVLLFYNLRREHVKNAQPNIGHIGIAELETHFDVTVITQNIDDLHERAGSKNVIHLHGEIFKARCEKESHIVVEWSKTELNLGDLCPNGHQLRPNIVWFGEPVDLLELAASIVKTADFFIVMGTSLQVYPAAGLIHEVSKNTKCFLVDPNSNEISIKSSFKIISKNACEGISDLTSFLLNEI